MIPHKKSVEEKLSEIDNSPRLNRVAERRYASVARKQARANGDESKLSKINDKFGYDYKRVESEGIKPDESGHLPSVAEDGKILKAPHHPTIKKTIKTERALGNKIFKVDGEMYTAPKTEAKAYRRALKNRL